MAFKLTKEQQNISNINHRLAVKHFESIGELPLDREPWTYCLHHKDESLRHNNIERYILWLWEDLEVKEYAKHTSEHKKGSHYIMSEKGKEHIRQNALRGENHPLHNRKGELHPNYGKHYNCGANNGMYGKHYEVTDETRSKMSASAKARGSNTKGLHWKLVDGKRMYY